MNEFLIKKKTKKQQQKNKKTKDKICEFALCTFNLLDRVVNFSCLFTRI